MASQDQATLWKQCTALQIQMKKSLKSNNNPFRKEIEELRSKLIINVFFFLFVCLFVFLFLCKC